MSFLPGRELVANARATLERSSVEVFRDRWTKQEIAPLAEADQRPAETGMDMKTPGTTWFMPRRPLLIAPFSIVAGTNAACGVSVGSRAHPQYHLSQ